MDLSGESPSKRPNRNEATAAKSSAPFVPTPLSEWALGLAPHLDVVSSSSPEPDVEDGTVVAVFATPDDARQLMLSWERLESADQAVGFVALGASPGSESSPPSTPDPEGVVRDAAARAGTGALLGGAVGLLVALVIGFLADWNSGAIVALIAGPLFGAVAGAVVVFVLRSGWGEGYMQSYVDPDATALAVCAVACRDAGHRDAAVAAARDASARQVLMVGADGRARKA